MPADLALTAFPRMELMGIEFLLGLLIVAGEIEQGDLLQQQVVALSNELGVLLKMFQPHVMVVAESLIELVELHEYSAVAGIEAESLLHIGHGLLRIVLLVKLFQSEVAPYGGECRVELSRTEPMLTGHIILTCTIVERAEIVVSLSVLGVMVDGSLQGQNRL